MLSCFDFIRDLNFLTITLRLVMAVICGGIIGIEREIKHRPAGFRTHILICLGAAMTTLTSQYMLLTMHMFTDVSRLGAQVIAGMGFIGAGTIIVTKNQRVKGLTTAAGLWTAAIIGLVCGAGYAELALLATVLVMFAELILARVEYSLAGKVKDVNLYIEYKRSANIESIMNMMNEKKIKMRGLEISRINDEDGGHYYCAVITLRLSKAQLNGELVKSFASIEDVISVEEL